MVQQPAEMWEFTKKQAAKIPTSLKKQLCNNTIPFTNWTTKIGVYCGQPWSTPQIHDFIPEIKYRYRYFYIKCPRQPVLLKTNCGFALKSLWHIFLCQKTGLNKMQTRGYININHTLKLVFPLFLVQSLRQFKYMKIGKYPIWMQKRILKSGYFLSVSKTTKKLH